MPRCLYLCKFVLFIYEVLVGYFLLLFSLKALQDDLVTVVVGESFVWHDQTVSYDDLGSCNRASSY